MGEYETPIRPEGAESVEERTQVDARVDYGVGDEGIPEFGVEEQEEEPIPVYLTNAIPRTVEELKCQLFNVPVQDSDTTQVLGDNPDRARAILRNTGASTVLLMSEKEGLRAFGFELVAAAELEITSQAEVWARCASTESSTVSVLVEEWPRYTNG